MPSAPPQGRPQAGISGDVEAVQAAFQPQQCPDTVQPRVVSINHGLEGWVKHQALHVHDIMLTTAL